MTSVLEGCEWSAARPGCTLPTGKSRYPFYRRLSGPQGRSGQAENLAPTGNRSPDRPARSQSLYRLSHPAYIRATTTVYKQRGLKMIPAFRLARHLRGRRWVNNLPRHSYTWYRVLCIISTLAYTLYSY